MAGGEAALVHVRHQEQVIRASAQSFAAIAAGRKSGPTTQTARQCALEHLEGGLCDRRVHEEEHDDDRRDIEILHLLPQVRHALARLHVRVRRCNEARAKTSDPSEPKRLQHRR